MSPKTSDGWCSAGCSACTSPTRFWSGGGCPLQNSIRSRAWATVSSRRSNRSSGWAVPGSGLERGSPADTGRADADRRTIRRAARGGGVDHRRYAYLAGAHGGDCRGNPRPRRPAGDRGDSPASIPGRPRRPVPSRCPGRRRGGIGCLGRLLSSVSRRFEDARRRHEGRPDALRAARDLRVGKFHPGSMATSISRR